MQRVRQMDWVKMKRDGFNIFTKLIRTKDPHEAEGEPELTVPTRQRLSRCLTTLDLTSLGVGSCVGTGMYLVAGMVARKFAGPGVIFSFIIAAIASIFSGACYAEFGVRVPHTTGSAYTYSYVTVGEFIAFIIGWNMILEYLIGTSACARALSACLDSLLDGAITRKMTATFGTIYGKPPDVVAFAITLMMTIVLLAGVRKSLAFNNILNGINLSIWVFIMGAGVFYIKWSNWTQNEGFLPYGWTGVFTGAATCFYAFIGFDIIATTGEEANNPKRSIPLAIVCSLGIILLAYVSSSMMLTLIVPYNEVETDSALVQMFGHVGAPTCKYIVAVGALAGLTVSMFGSMFPMPRIVFAMAQDGLIFRRMGCVWVRTGTPAVATMSGGMCASIVALLIQLEVLVEMMSIGTLLAYTLVSTCVLILRYQPHTTNLIELLPQRLRTPVVGSPPAGTRNTTFMGFHGDLSHTAVMTGSQHRVMVRRVTRSSPDSDDTLPGDDSEEYGGDDAYLVSDRSENKFYGVPSGPSASTGFCSRFCNAIYRKLNEMSYLCPGLFPWVDCGPATEYSGMFVIKAVGVMYVLIIIFDMFAAYGSPGTCAITTFIMVVLFLAIFAILLAISRKPQNRAHLIYATPCLPFVPAIAITVNIYLIMNLSILTLIRFTFWMVFGLIMYFKYGISHSTLEETAAAAAAAPTPQPGHSRASAPPQPQRVFQDKNIFEGDNSAGLYGKDSLADPLLAWHDSDLHVPQTSQATYIEQRFNENTNRTSTHTISRPPWAHPDKMYEWDD